MSDITMCNIPECKFQDSCYRHTATPNKYKQSYFMYPQMDCIDKGYFMYWDTEEE